MGPSKEDNNGAGSHTSANSSTPHKESTRKENTGPITTATNRTDDKVFTHPQHDMSAPGCKSREPDSAAGMTTAVNHTGDDGFTTPGEDMSQGRKTRKL
ncbi:hypothetical protein NLG97_g3653 [Lecanicillium saksenae]|uniref:Uncharacterized protein n=1 Tax=Lecanicillium saksenae TaxID=468837 RepID=A0ACC1R0T0_9HYPO|nr:hypothetical protein NLG97_g3653 [Lecanicillium saksenae]